MADRVLSQFLESCTEVETFSGRFMLAYPSSKSHITEATDHFTKEQDQLCLP